MAIDLHIHSTASDGTVPPEKLPALGRQAGLHALALTDHDTVAGVADFLAQQPEFPELELIAGVELSSRYAAREIHMIGLFLDCANSELADFLATMRKERRRRAELLRERLEALGYPLSDADLLEAGASETPGRPHFARALVNRYHFSGNLEVFERLLKRGAPAYVPRILPAPEEALQAIKAAGGTAVWAHPIRNHTGEIGFARRILARLVPLGLDGVEAYYTDFTPWQTACVLKLAEEFRLAPSGGSDFHGANHPHVALGSGRGDLNVPDEVLLRLRKAREPKLVVVDNRRTN